MKIYIIQGNSGEYSDRTDWLVKAYTDKDKAEKARNFLELKLKEFGLGTAGENVEPWKDREENSKEMEQYDPNFYCDYTGTYYTILTVDLEE